MQKESSFMYVLIASRRSKGYSHRKRKGLLLIIVTSIPISRDYDENFDDTNAGIKKYYKWE